MSLVDQKHKNEAVRGKDNDWLVGKNESHEVIFYIRRVKVDKSRLQPGLHKLWYPGIRDRSTWSKFGAHGEHGDVFLFSNLGAL